jgi:N-acetylglucosamine kinase-like BadF-type ATPase
MEAIYLGTIDQHRLTELPRLVFKASSAGDAAAGEIVDRLGDEIVAMVTSALRRLRMTRRDTEVVLGGGVARGRDPRLMARIREGVAAVAPAANVSVVDAPPVVGSALLGLDEIGARKGAYARARAALTHDRMTGPRRER